jgi:DNA primase
LIPDEEVERVRESADIVAIVGEHVQLKRVGADWRGPCPFHQGTHRNFSVSPRRRVYHCFVCGEKGDVFSFLQKRLGVDWPTSVRMVAQKSGVEIREVHTRREGPDPREPLWEANAVAQAYFERILWDDPLGQQARDYLEQREVDPELAKRFGLGFAPREIGLMRASLATLGFDDERQLQAGLLVRPEEASEPRPRFRGRLTFPIHDNGGRLAGFGGRLIGPGEPKYLNTAESPTFSKGKLLYGLHAARNAIRRAERALLVEGYFDVVRLVGAGIEEVVAPLGTALTPDQAALLARYTKAVFLLYDSDKAGLKATFRSGDELLKQGVTVRVVSLPAGEDPDTYVRAHGRDGLERQVSEALDVFERKVQLLQRGGWFADLHRRRKAIDRLLPTIRAASDTLLRDMYIGRAAEVSGVDRGLLAEEAGGARRGAAASVGGAQQAPSSRVPVAARGSPRTQRRTRAGARLARRPAAERELIRAMLYNRALAERIVERVGPERFDDEDFRMIFRALLTASSETPLDEVATGLTPEAVDVLNSLVREAPLPETEQTVEDSILRIEIRDLERESTELRAQMRVARAGEENELLKRLQENWRTVERLKAALGAAPRDRSRTTEVS